MVDMFANEFSNYMQKWHALIGSLDRGQQFASFKPTSLGWKVEDLAEFTRICDGLRDRSAQVHYGWVNERWLATFYLKQSLQPGNVRIIKIMQRRPGSQDAVGLDHVDFLIASFDQITELLNTEKNLKWSQEQNGDHCKWVSIWFEGTEAKLRTDTVLQVCADEMIEFQQKLLGDIK